jgi:predicted O-methyltransferase YrrM
MWWAIVVVDLRANAGPNCSPPLDVVHLLMPPERGSADLNLAAMLLRASSLLPDFCNAISDLQRESGFGGIGPRGMFFFYAAVRPCAPRQILESGRMRGGSTLMLARCFPQARIVSVEFDRDPVHAAVAESRLKPYANVELLYGDSRDILPERLEPGDAVLIDGPKGFRALKLALQLLRTGKPCAVLIHDFYPREPARKFVERYWPNAFFSDDPAFAIYLRELNARIGRDPDSKHSVSPFVCLPAGLPAAYPLLLFRIICARGAAIVVSKMKRLFRASPLSLLV